MKRLKISFLFIVAVTAMGFTVATSSNIFDEKPMATDDCFREITVKRTCQHPNDLMADWRTTCLEAHNYQVPPPAAHVWYMTGGISSDEIASECTGQEIFCCAQLLDDLNPCISNPQQPKFDLGNGPRRYKIGFVYCKSQ